MPARFWAVAEGGRRRRRSLGGGERLVGGLVGGWFGWWGVWGGLAYRAASKGSAIVFLVERLLWTL